MDILQSKEKVIQIELPASKSISNRLLIIQKLASEKFEISNLSKANDTVILKNILVQEPLPQNIYCQDAGTVLRFMTCLCAALPNQEYILSGTPRLMARPMEPLLTNLRQLGANIEIRKNEASETLLSIKGNKLKNSLLTIAGNVSSQFISGLCLISPLIEGGLELEIKEEILSKPYIEITLNLLSEFGIKSIFRDNKIRIEQQPIITKDKTVENDWSAASFFYAYKILSNETPSIFLEGLGEDDIQGDKHIFLIGQKLGVQTTFSNGGALLNNQDIDVPSLELNLSAYPDIAIPLIVACAFRYPEIRFTGLTHLRDKESDRIHAIKHNLEKFGIYVNEEQGVIFVEKKEKIDPDKPIRIQTFSDHRIAMSFSLLGALGYDVTLDNINCIAKSFPDFLSQIHKLGIKPKN